MHLTRIGGNLGVKRRFPARVLFKAFARLRLVESAYLLIKITDPFPVSSSEITPEALYAGRRRFLKQLGLVAGASIGALGSVAAVVDTGAQLPSLNVARKSEMAGGESLTPYEAITHYNNYYEFGTEKDDPARNAGRLRTRPWSVVVDGECEAPGRIDLDDLIKPHVLE